MDKAVFLDRDGVINDNQKHVNKPEDLVLYSWTRTSIRCLNQAGYKVFVVTNQGGIEMGYFTEADLNAIHSHLSKLLLEEDAVIDEYSYCPHFSSPCKCRKPKPGLITTLAKKHQLDLKNSWMIGDRTSDIQAGVAAGCKTIKIGDTEPLADFNCKNLQEAVNFILSNC